MNCLAARVLTSRVLASPLPLCPGGGPCHSFDSLASLRTALEGSTVIFFSVFWSGHWNRPYLQEAGGTCLGTGQWEVGPRTLFAKAEPVWLFALGAALALDAFLSLGQKVWQQPGEES